MTPSQDRIRAISFDAYGTLLHLDRPFYRLVENLQRIGLEVPLEIATKVFIQEMLYYREHHMEGSTPETLLSLRHKCAKRLFTMLAEEGYPARVSEEQRLLVLMGAIHFELYEDVLPVLEWCRAQGLTTGIVSNWDCSLKDTLAKLCAHDFACLVVSACEGVEKGNTGLFLRAAQCFNLPPSEILHVGDEADNDLYRAEQAGLRTVLLDREGTQRHLDACRIETLGEFPALFQRLFI